jgi:diguanylate cyclase
VHHQSTLPDHARDLTEPGYGAVSDNIKHLLSEILEGLIDKERASELWQRAKLRTEKSMDWQQLEETLIDLRDLLAGREKGLDQAISSYLNQVNQELHGICERLGIGLLAHQKQEVAADLLGQAVTHQMEIIHSSIDSSTNLDGLKQDIRLHISVINEALQTFRDQQAQERPPSEELHALLDRVKTIESESAQTKELLRKERHRANHDALTELPNREAYNQRVQLEWQRFRRYGRPLTLAVVDIDRFKQLNDQYGHQVGDKVLRLVAQTLAKCLRAADFVARYGGEEFVVLLPETGPDDAFRMMDNARQAIADSAFRFKNKPVVLTFSCGLSGFTTDDEIGTVFERADKALYSAKNNGRNQTCKG